MRQQYGFSLKAAVRCTAEDRSALANMRKQLNASGQPALKLKTNSRDRATRLAISSPELVQPVQWPVLGRQVHHLCVGNGSAVPLRHREQRTVDGSLASTSIERLLSGFGPPERTTAYVRSTS
jgi:hypothetical protein